VAKEHTEFLTSLNRLHVMHHAVQGELYGLCMMKELKPPISSQSRHALSPAACEVAPVFLDTTLSTGTEKEWPS
jgi:hypothetical protein